MGEFELIRQYFTPLGQSRHEDVVLGIGDDCAVIRPPANAVLCCSLDTMVEGRHFPFAYAPARAAHRAMAAALSDLAAMGASASHFTLALTLPAANPDWLQAFADSMSMLAKEYGVTLVGGDTCRGPLTISLQVHGWVTQPNAPLTRAGARVGDIVLVSGSLGAASAALALLSKISPSSAEQRLLERYHAPTPRLALGQALLPYASACIDISDGLVADAAHIASASGCAIQLDAKRLPLLPEMSAMPEHDALIHALTGGDDYELLVTLPASAWSIVQQQSWANQLTEIGVCVAGAGVHVCNAPAAFEKKGFLHFE